MYSQTIQTDDLLRVLLPMAVKSPRHVRIMDIEASYGAHATKNTPRQRVENHATRLNRQKRAKSKTITTELRLEGNLKGLL